MRLTLRPYQLALVDRVRGEYRTGARSVLMQGATGFGKTTTASDIIRRSVALGRRVVFSAHLDALIDDTSDRLTAARIEHGIVQADRPTNATPYVQIASLATLHRRGERPPADLLILDECHRAMAGTVREDIARESKQWPNLCGKRARAQASCAKGPWRPTTKSRSTTAFAGSSSRPRRSRRRSSTATPRRASWG